MMTWSAQIFDGVWGFKMGKKTAWRIGRVCIPPRSDATLTTKSFLEGSAI